MPNLQENSKMYRRKAFYPALLIIAVLYSSFVTGQTVHEPPITNNTWKQSYPPFRIAGNLYYVGTADLASYLITTREGNILINTGLASSDTQIVNNIRALGFSERDLKILLTTQAHYDHMGAMLKLRQLTGAHFMVDEEDAAVCRDGGKSDYALGGSESSYAPIEPDRLLHDKDTIRLGDMSVVLLHHPGHTKGSCSYIFTVSDEAKSYRVLIANLPTIVTDHSFHAIPAYPGIAADYAYTLNSLKSQQFDIWLASHASQFDLDKKHQPGDPYNPAAFMDRKGYDAALKELKSAYRKKLKQQ